MKKKLSLTEKISLAENNAVDFMHACVTIALHDEYEVGVQRLRKVNLRRDEINEEMLEVMAQPRKSGREQAAAGQAWLVSLLPEGAETEFRVPLGKGAARKQKELQIRMAVDNAATLWRDQQRQHKRRGKHRWDITREKVEVAYSRKAYKARLQPKKTENAQAKPPKRPAKPKMTALPVPKPAASRAPRVRLKKYLTDPTPLQRDVRELEGYNAKARERGKKELSYGYWAAEGKPAAPAW